MKINPTLLKVFLFALCLMLTILWVKYGIEVEALVERMAQTTARPPAVATKHTRGLS